MLTGVQITEGVRGTGSVWGTPMAKPAVPRAKPAAQPANSSQAQTNAPRPLDGNDLAASAASALLGLQKGQREQVSAMPHSAAPALPARTAMRLPNVTPSLDLSESGCWAGASVAQAGGAAPPPQGQAVLRSAALPRA
ncbi:MAG: hypothetical protein ACK56I_01145, partial [bacterium]